MVIDPEQSPPVAMPPGPGPGVDAIGRPVIDPTANVLQLVEAAIKRQDDLRITTARHLEEIGHLRAEHYRELRRAESDRLDAIRAVDVTAVQQAAQVSATQASTLAAQVATSAETLRTQVAAAATAATVALAAALEPIQKDIADLRRAQYEAQGSKIQTVETQQAGASNGMWVGVGIAALGLLLTFAAIAIALLFR